jgi:nucleoside-diphosphate-sugar epimerase
VRRLGVELAETDLSRPERLPETLGTPRIANPALIATLRGRRWNASNRRAREVLGWQPRIALEQSLRETMSEIRRRRAEVATKVKQLRPT